MLNIIRDFLYGIGFYKNELCDCVIQNQETLDRFLGDIDFMERGYHKYQPKKSVQTIANFEKTMEAVARALEKR